MWKIELVTGVDPDGVNPLDAMKKLTNTPLLLIHSEKDPKIPIQNSIDILNLAQGKAELWTTPGDVYVGSYEDNPGLYLEKVVQFVDEHL